MLALAGAQHDVTASPQPDPRVRAAAEGDRAAAEELLTELLPRARNLIRYLVRGDGDVDDIAQEAMIALLRGFGSYRGEGELSSWADRVVVRATFGYLKRARRHTAMRDDLPELAAVPAPDAPPDRYAERRQLARMLDEIPDDQRHIMVLHHVIGMSMPEAAEELGVKLETARSRLRLGMQRMRARMDTARGDS